MDDLPPSWQRDVEGRQTREEAEAELKANAEAANKEDAVSGKRSTSKGTRNFFFPDASLLPICETFRHDR